MPHDMADTAQGTVLPLLSETEPPAYNIINPQGQTACILICEHAAKRIPASLDKLGLTAQDQECHYAVDIGAQKVTEYLSTMLDAPAILANYSRMVVDLNRSLDHPTAFVTQGEGRPIPGNINMSKAERARRIKALYDPFHDAVSQMIETTLSRGVIPVVIAIHSFTPVFYKQRRPWDIGVLWLQDARLPSHTIRYFSQKGFCVGDNEPYDARYIRGTTIDRHADARGLPNVLVEIRNDLITDDDGARQWAEMLAACYRPVFTDGIIHCLYDGPQTAYDPEAAALYFDNLIERAKKGDGDE